MNDRKQRLGAEFGRYAVLSVLGMMAVSCYILADTFFVAQGLGSAGLAALNLAIPVYNIIHGVGLLLGMGGATRFSVLKSQQAHREANVVYTHTLGMAALAAVVFMLIGLLAAGPVAALLGAEGEVHAMTATYLRVLLLFSPAFIFNDVLQCFVRNDGAPQLSMTATVTGSLANIVMDYIFIFPCGLGIFGAVLATGFSPVIGILIQAPHWLNPKCGFRPAAATPGASVVARILALGVPSLLEQLSGAVVMVTFNWLILRLAGNTGVAAYGVVANLSLVVLAVYSGLAQGMQPLVSRAWGHGDRADLFRLLRYALLSMAAVSAVVYLGIFAGAGAIASVFNSEADPALQAIAVQGLRLYFIGAPFAGANVILCIWFTSVERAVPAQTVSLLRGLVVIVPAALALAAALGMPGVWLAFPVSEALVFGVACKLFFGCRSKLYPPSHESA